MIVVELNSKMFEPQLPVQFFTVEFSFLVLYFTAQYHNCNYVKGH